MAELDVNSLIRDLAFILLLGAISTILFKKLKQPIVLGYIVAGFLASPHFAFLPDVGDAANVEFWGQIGIVVLLFTLGLEFSFQKLVNVGGSAVISALVIVSGMLGLGYITGQVLGLDTVNSIFLGGMLSMSSTMIIIKTYSDLNLRQKSFASLVLAVLVVEDIFAVVMLVMLSSVAINKTVAGDEMIQSVLKLSFFLIMWFVVGVFLIPSFFRKHIRLINDEMLLICSMALCLFMAMFSVYCGFSMALGAFVMGSILAGTVHAERIENVMKPVKDLFGAVFFISVGMTVDPVVVAENIKLIAVLSCVVVVGMIIFGTLGMLITGQSLRNAIMAGFSLTQIGEFSFIIASLGLSLHVLVPELYPIVVAVSVITTFFTPFFIRRGEPAYKWVAKRLPKKLHFLIESYSRSEVEASDRRLLWIAVLKRYAWRLILYTVLALTVNMVVYYVLLPYLLKQFSTVGANAIAVITSFAASMPFLIALVQKATDKDEYDKLAKGGKMSRVPFVVMNTIRYTVALILVMNIISSYYSVYIVAVVVAVVAIALSLYYAPNLRKAMGGVETHFINNLNERELRRSGKKNVVVQDLHIAYMRVGYGCPFVGEKLLNSDLRKKYGVNVVSITRGGEYYPVPSGDMRIFPGDVISIIGTEKQIQNLLPQVERESSAKPKDVNVSYNIGLTKFALTENSILVGKTLAASSLGNKYETLLVAISRNGQYLNIDPSLVFEAGDVLWAVCDKTRTVSLLR